MATATSTLINDYMAAKALSNALRNEISARLNSELTPEQFIALKLASAGDICATEASQAMRR